MKSKQIGDAAERLFQKALAASASGDAVQAERLYRLAIGMVAGRSEPRHNLGALLRSLGHLEEARDLLAGARAGSGRNPLCPRHGADGAGRLSGWLAAV